MELYHQVAQGISPQTAPQAVAKYWPKPSDVQEIRVDENPTWPKWRFVPLFHDNVDGATMIWQIGYDGDRTLQIYTGHLYGNPRIITSELDQVQGKTLQEKALVDARHRYLIKYRNEGYRPAGDNTPMDVAGMFANVYVSSAQYAETERLFNEALEEYKQQYGSYPTGKERTQIRNRFFNAKWKRITRFPVATQAKLDGHRIMAKLVGDQVKCRKPRSNRPFNNTRYQEHDLKPLFAFLPPGCQPDGELYHPDWSFETLSSVVKTETTVHPQMDQVIFYIFDLYTPTPMPFEDRYKILFNAYKRYIEEDPSRLDPPGSPGKGNTIRLVTYTLAYNEADIDSFHDQFVELGYEGLMVRKLAGPNRTATSINESLYEPGKHSNNILKYKAFEDEEGIVLGVEAAGNTNDEANVIILTQSGKVVSMRPRGSAERRESWLNNPGQILLKPFTYRHQPPLTNDGYPRFPIGIDVRDEDPAKLGLTPEHFAMARQIIATKYPQFHQYIR